MKRTNPRFQYRLYPIGKLRFQPYKFNGRYWEAISPLQWRKAAQEILEREDPDRAKRIRNQDIDEAFGDLVIEDVNTGTTGKILQSDGTVLDLDQFSSPNNVNETAVEWPPSFVRSPEEYVDSYITMRFGATYIPSREWNNQNPILEFFQERIADDASLSFLLYVLCHALTGRISVKAIVMLLNIRFNTGKSVAMFILFTLFGSYAVKVAPQLFQRENIERLNKFLFVHKDCLLIIIDETDAGFRPEIPTLKKITGRDLFANSYASTFQDQFSVRGMLFIDSNEVLQHRGETSSGIESRLFLIPFGQPVPRENRIWGLVRIPAKFATRS